MTPKPYSFEWGITPVRKERITMGRMSKKRKEEMAFFLDERGRISYHEKCRQCVRECKQSYKVKGIYCPMYESKRAVT